MTSTPGNKDPSSDTARSVHLSASAGSGKTRALKERYLAILELLEQRGLTIDQAVAITFTDKAAAEIRERVLQGLPEAALKKIVRGTHDLRISTIHSFCMNLLKRYPLEAGLPPDFGVLDSRDQAHKLRKAVEEALEDSDGEPAIMDPLREFGTDGLIDAVEFLLSIRSRLKRLEIDFGGADGLLRAVNDGMDLERTGAELQELITDPEWRTSLLAMEQLLKTQDDYYEECLAQEHRRLAEAAGIESARELTARLTFIYFNKDGSAGKKCYIPKSRYSGKNRDEYEKMFFAVQDMLGRFLTLDARVRSGREAFSLLTLFQTAEKKYQAAKLREGVLDFDDLEIYAYGLLRGIASPDILYWLDRKILHFLIDEFQDTSDIQWAILDKLTEEIFAGEGADKPLAPTLFVVGDEKQSIYRFREANYRLIENVRRKMEQVLRPTSREILTLDKNYRSAPEVVETVNQVFARLWPETYKRSEPDRAAHSGSVRLIELPPPSNNGSGITEAQALANEIKSLITNDITVWERTAEAGWRDRPAGYGDCAILIQSRTRLKEYERALQEEQVPYQVIGGIGFYEEDEIQALMNVLFFLWNRDDHLALAAALKSPLFGLTDHAIFCVLHGPGPVLDSLQQHYPGEGRLLMDWMNLSGLVPLAVLIHRILQDTGGYVRFGKARPQAIFNIDKLLDTAREFDRRGYTSLQDFVEWVKNIRSSEQREATADMNLPGFEGSVSVMTVHKAKGLEYPIVFLPGMNQQNRSLSAGPLAVVDDSEGRIRIAIRDGSPVYRELWDREREELLREHQRLLYVAMTRARDHLVMIGTLNDGSRAVRENTWLDYLHQAAPQPLFSSVVATERGFTRYSCPAVPPDAGVRDVPSPNLARGQHGHERKIDLPSLLTNLAPAPRSVSCEWKKATDYIDQRDDGAIGAIAHAPATGLSPLTRGTILHRCLEQLTRDGRYDLDGILNEYADVMTLPADIRKHAADDIDSVMNGLLSDDHLAWVFERRPASYSELPFLYRAGRALVSGVIDRLVVKEDAGCVIDYKAIRIQDESDLASWVDHYRPQVRIYCEAVKEMFALRSVQGYLLFLDSNKLTLCTSV